MTMNLTEYCKLASRTVKHMPSKYMDLWHACTGMATEYGEIADAFKRHVIYGKPLDVANIQEELGDLLWYVALHSNTTDIAIRRGKVSRLSEGLEEEVTELHKMLTHISVNTCGLAVMSMITYESDEARLEARDDTEQCYSDIVFGIARISEMHGSTLGEVMEKNIAKLAARYGDKYSDFKALNRDTAAEQEAMGGPQLNC